MIMEQLMREKLLTVKKEMEGFMKESQFHFGFENGSIKNTAVIWYALIPKES